MESKEGQQYLDITQAWVEKFVVGLNLCPFAPPVVDGKRLRYTYSAAENIDVLYQNLLQEMEFLALADPDEWETTLLVHPHVLQDFYLYNDFLEIVDEALEAADLAGALQVASFHPQYLFAGEDPEASSHYTNRSPYPMLHLLREDSLENALKSYPKPEEIPQNNIVTMQNLGLKKIRKMLSELGVD
ncbi:MAG TPA: DUF1415 domain-containing protein [Bacteroidetes bacterium]|nr:DUF1415 domain-containing protein [Bacteroidota bacterium]